MTDPEKGTASALPAHVSWNRLNDGLVGGIHHTLNNRMAALSAVAQLLETDLPAEHPLAGAMTAELQRLQSTVSMLSLLVGGDAAEPIQLETVLRSATKLFELHHSLRDLELDVDLSPDLYPLWISPSALRRAVMVMLAVVGKEARGGDRRVRLGAEGDERRIQIEVSTASPTDQGQEEEDVGLVGVNIGGAESLLERWGGRVEAAQEDGGLLVRATVPTLPEARRLGL